ncbi:unnamed protein product [Rhizopus stolonifer]
MFIWNPLRKMHQINVGCVYTVLPSPKDLEYLQELEYMEQIKVMEQQLVVMEKEMNTMKLARDSNGSSTSHVEENDYPSPISLRSYETNHSRDETIKTSNRLVNEGEIEKREKRSYTIAKHNQVEASITEQRDKAKPWQLTLKNGNVIIDTHVSSYSDLMNSLSTMLVAQKQVEHPILQSFVRPYVGNTITNSLTIVMWKKYGKSRLKSMVRFKPIFIPKLEAKQPVTVIPLDSLTSFTFQLIYAYINCFHTIQFAIHSQSFIDLFMSHQQDILRSPVVMALCSDICQRPCKHVLKIIPIDSAADYAQYYFEQARDIISDRFDETSLEAFATFVFMASYKLKTWSLGDATKYLSIAEHMYRLLLPSYENTMKNKNASSEAKMFGRLSRQLSHIQHVLEMKSITEDKSDKRKMIRKAMSFPNHSDHSIIYHAEDESPKEAHYAFLKNSVFHLRNNVKEAARSAFGSDLSSYFGTFTHIIEMAIRHWYYHDLPQKFRLSLPLFEDMDDFKYFTVLEQECLDDSPFGAIASLSAYNEYLIASKTFFPKTLEEASIKTEDILDLFYKQEDQLPEHCDNHKNYPIRSKLLIKMNHIRKHHIKEFLGSYQGSEDEFFRDFIGAMNPNAITFNAPHIQISIISALNIVRLVQFLNNHGYSCSVEVGWIMNAWEILRRAAKLESKMAKTGTITPDRIKANMFLCVKFLETIANFTQNNSAHAFVNTMKEEFLTLV